LTVAVDESPTAVPMVPLNAGFGAFVEVPSAGAERATAGAIVSSLNVIGWLRPTFPAWSACSAWPVYVPSPSAPAATLYDPAGPLTVLRTWSGVPVGADPE